jgi:hypothetical protein
MPKPSPRRSTSPPSRCSSRWPKNSGTAERSSLYRLPSRLLAANAIDRYSIGDRSPGITYAEDGSLEIALQPAEPTDPVRRANWLPTRAGEPFTVIYRMYGPGEQAQAGAWSLPSIRPAS